MRRTVVTQRAIWDTYLGQSLRSCAVPSRAKVERGVERAEERVLNEGRSKGDGLLGQICGALGVARLHQRVDQAMANVQSVGRSGELPDRLHPGPARGDGVLDLRHVYARLGDGDGRADVEAVGELVGEHLADQMAERIERNDPLGLELLAMRPDAGDGGGILKVGRVARIERAGGDRERAVDRIGAARHADGVARLPGRGAGRGRAARLASMATRATCIMARGMKNCRINITCPWEPPSRAAYTILPC